MFAAGSDGAGEFQLLTESIFIGCDQVGAHFCVCNNDGLA